MAFMDIFSKKKEYKDLTIEEKIGYLFGEKQRLIKAIDTATKRREAQLKEDRKLSIQFDVIIGKLQELGIKNF